MMTNQEQSRSHSAEREFHTPELYSYLSVLEALSGHGAPTDDIACIGDVIERWSENLPSWATIEDVRRIYAELKVVGDMSDASQKSSDLLQQAERLLTQEYWNQAEELRAYSEEIIRRRPGQFYAQDTQSKQLFTIEAFSLADSRVGPAELFVAGAEDTIIHRSSALKMYVDATQLQDEEREAVGQYVVDVGITAL